MKKKQIVQKIISRIPTKRNGYCRLKHKSGWLEYLKDGDTVFTIRQLKAALEDIINQPDLMPQGNKLFNLHRKFNFTMTAQKKPFRQEEALERFIIASNPRISYNQIPVGGGKESIDIGLQENHNGFVFVELKSWKSSDSPLYAIVESLKNLVEYRTIIRHQIKPISIFRTIELMILAPMQYYRSFKLIDLNGKTIQNHIERVNATLNKISDEFKVRLSLMAIDLRYEKFLEKCSELYDLRNLNGQAVITISEKDKISSLKRKNWKNLLATDLGRATATM